MRPTTTKSKSTTRRSELAGWLTVPATLPADNCLTITGRMVGSCETRTSPGGIVISRFLLEHHSGQVEAGIPREARCRIPVVACGDPLVQTARCLSAGVPVRVQGFVSRANYREGEYRLVLHAAHIEIFEIE